MMFLLIAGAALATMVAPGPPGPAEGPLLAALTYEPVALDPADPARRALGSLVYLEGWALRSDTPRFGGISGMHVEGGEVIAINDSGTILRFALPGRTGAGQVAMLPLPREGRIRGPKSSRDSEAMLVRGDRMWVTFERSNMVSAHRRSDFAQISAARPAAMRRWRSNTGAEAIARLPDGRFVIFAEGRSDDDPHSDVVLFEGDPSDAETRTHRLRYRRQPGYRVTDAAVLPDGRLLVLNRGFGLLAGFSAMLTIVDPAGLREGAILEGREAAIFAPPLTADNMEALSVTVENGRTIVWIASDDNFFPFQRTLLMKFALVE
jgi:hypothetical protein